MMSLVEYQQRYDAQTVRQRVEAAGVVGAGGAGFPTHVKLNANAEIYLVNGAECEPLLAVDQQLAVTQAELLVKGLIFGMIATGAKEGIIALKAKYQAAIERIEPLLPANIRIHILPDVYPAGDEVITIWLATGRRVPPAAIPLSIGVVVSNVQSMINVARAVEEQTPVTERTLTVNGAVNRPMTLTLPIGASLREVLALAGGATVANPAYINGGPMMGQLIEDIDSPVTKTTGGLLVFPSDHILIQRRRQTERQIINMAKTVCEQCCLCTELCPRHIIGHELSPHLLVRAISYQQVAKPSILTSALTCSECSVCESYACPVGISPMRINKLLKGQLRAQNARYEGPLYQQDPMAEQRMVPTKRLISRLAISDYYQRSHAPMTETDWRPQEVRIALRQHIGAPASSLVNIGDNVERGQLIADINRADKQLGAAIHASITGKVTSIDDRYITLCRQ
jgi:Na+-translocating ferredoxin:NAD+ oxidoreductase RnfC subunit